MDKATRNARILKRFMKAKLVTREDVVLLDCDRRIWDDVLERFANPLPQDDDEDDDDEDDADEDDADESGSKPDGARVGHEEEKGEEEIEELGEGEVIEEKKKTSEEDSLAPFKEIPTSFQTYQGSSETLTTLYDRFRKTYSDYAPGMSVFGGTIVYLYRLLGVGYLLDDSQIDAWVRKFGEYTSMAANMWQDVNCPWSDFHIVFADKSLHLSFLATHADGVWETAPSPVLNKKIIKKIATEKSERTMRRFRTCMSFIFEQFVQDMDYEDEMRRWGCTDPWAL